MLYNGTMPTQVLATKLFIPPPRPNAVFRGGLLARLNEGLHRKLTLLSAPAGFGKTSLASAWITACGRPAAWLALDGADRDPSRFLAAFIAALQTVVPALGADIAGILQAPQPPPIDALLPLLLNQIAALPKPAILVLDDYHVIDARPVDDALAFLVEHLPPQLHLVIVTREDPPLPLARLRARGQLTELRAADLRFTATEAAAFLQDVMGISLSAAEVATLEARTEGWVAGLQLAALSMQRRADVSAFIQAFAGDHRYILDYLLEEVLLRLPEDVRSFLLQTAILDRLHAPLCDAVTGQTGSGAQLEALYRGNFFVVPLDDRRQWYRYHHLFADVLKAQLQAEEPDLILTLHQRASAWYEQQGSSAEAIRHAFAAQDFARAAALIEAAVPSMRNRRQEAAVLGWLKALPDDVRAVRPVLSVAYAWASMAVGEFAAVDAQLRAAEEWLGTWAARHGERDTPASAMVVVDAEALRRLPGEVAIYRAGHSQALGNVADTVMYARRALDLVPEDDHLHRGAALALLGLASWTSGDIAAAHQLYADGVAQLERAGLIAHVIGCVFAMGDIRVAQGRLRDARRTYERGMQLAIAPGKPMLRGAADMHLGLAEVLSEQNDMPAATQHLLRSQVLGEHLGLPQHPSRWCVAMARVREDQGDLDGALDLLEEAERRYAGDFSPPARPIGALRARVWLAQGRVGEALAWTREQGLSVQDELNYVRELAHITLARVLLAQHAQGGELASWRDAVELLRRLLQAAEAAERTGNVIEILVVLARAHHMQGDVSAALAALGRALTLAEPEGYVRLFVAEGAPMALLLREAAARQITPAYTARLLAACAVEHPARASAPPPPTSLTAQPPIEPLSQRELDVLRLLRTELSGPEIARELVIGLSTVRTYTKSIYAKLNVTSRRAAVNRAVELGLL